MKVAIIGKMCAGKTTCSNYLIEKYGFTRISLAGPVYQVVTNLDKYDSKDLYYRYLHPYIKPALSPEEQEKFIRAIKYVRDNIPEEKPKPRRRLQWFGTEGGRKTIRESIWIDILLEKIHRNGNKNVVVDDVRFKNELAALKANGFLTIKLEVDRETQIKRIEKLYGHFNEEILKHGSEIEIDSLKGHIHLDATVPLEEMLSNLDNAIKDWGKL